MSGNLWMFSDMLDDEDIEMQKHDFNGTDVRGTYRSSRRVLLQACNRGEP